MRRSPIQHDYRRHRRGAAILELALTLGILLNLTFGAVEFTYFFYVKNALEGAAREGCRGGIISGATNSNVTTAVTNALNGFPFPSGSVSTTITDTSGNSLDVSTASNGTQVQVNVSATWSTIGAGFRPLNLISGTKTVKGICVMRKES